MTTLFQFPNPVVLFSAVGYFHSATMYSTLIPVACFIVFFGYFILWPVIVYFYDAKGFRKYPSMNAVAGFTDLGFMYEATKGFRSKRLSELHQKYPVIRIGPNSLSFRGIQAIKVSS